MDEKYAEYLLSKTQQDYNKIAEHFSITRGFFEKDLRNLLRFLKDKEKVLDLGCGNGRLRKALWGKNIEYVGVDNSEELVKIAKIKYPKEIFLKANALDLPFSENYFNKIFSIAVFHHIPSKKLRLKFLKEAKRVLKPEGLLIVTVWNLYQKRFFKSHLKYTLLKILGLSRLDFRDIFFLWKSQEGRPIVQRYLHSFTQGELKKLIKKSGLKLKEIGFLEKEKKNIYLVAEK